MDKKQVKNQWEKVSKTYSNSRDSDGPETQLIYELLDKFDYRPKVLDIGCGDGERTLSNLTEGSVGIDISNSGLEIAQDSVSKELVQADMSSLPFKDDSFDAITAYFAVFHISRDSHKNLYSEFRRVLNPNGKMLMTLPSGRYETVRRGWMGGKMLFSSPGKQKTLQMIKDSGFSDITVKKSNDPLGGSTEFVFAEV
jgi:ubiquinone/menaquinone biosynthesis C-methylase UbiE